MTKRESGAAVTQNRYFAASVLQGQGGKRSVGEKRSVRSNVVQFQARLVFVALIYRHHVHVVGQPKSVGWSRRPSLYIFVTNVRDIEV